VTLKLVCGGYAMYRPRVSDAFFTDSVDMTLATSAVFSELHDQLASLERHAELTRCFSAVAQQFKKN